MLRHPYDTPTVKTNALRLVSNEGLLKRLCSNINSLAPPAPLKEKGSGKSLYIEVRKQECNYVT